METWKDIEGYEGLYQVSTEGRVSRIKGDSFRILKGNRLPNGYLTVGLSKNNKAKTRTIHRLVAIAFIENINVLAQEVNHKDGNKQNNSMENLEWVTKSENEQHSFKVLGKKMPELPNKMRGKLGKLHNRSIPIQQFTISGEYIRDWECASQVQRELGITKSNVSMCCNGNRKSAGKFIFKYKQTIS